MPGTLEVDQTPKIAIFGDQHALFFPSVGNNRSVISSGAQLRYGHHVVALGNQRSSKSEIAAFINQEAHAGYETRVSSSEMVSAA